MAVGLIFGAKIIHANLMCKGHNTYCQSQLTLSACVLTSQKVGNRQKSAYSSGMLKLLQWGKSHKSLSSIQSMLIFQCKNNFGTKQKWRMTQLNDQDRARLQNYSVLIAPAWATYVTSRQSKLRQEHARVQSERNVKILSIQILA